MQNQNPNGYNAEENFSLSPSLPFTTYQQMNVDGVFFFVYIPTYIDVYECIDRSMDGAKAHWKR